MAEEVVTELRCAYHPDRSTVLRCNRCDKPICVECGVRTPVGVRCRDCVRSQQSIYYTGRSYDLVIGTVVAFVAGGIAGALAAPLLGMIGFFRLILALVGGPALGGAIAEIVRRSVGRRRARHLRALAAVALALGMLFGAFALLLLAAFSDPRMLTRLLPLLISRFDVLILAALAATTLYARLV